MKSGVRALCGADMRASGEGSLPVGSRPSPVENRSLEHRKVKGCAWQRTFDNETDDRRLTTVLHSDRLFLFHADRCEPVVAVGFGAVDDAVELIANGLRDRSGVSFADGDFVDGTDRRDLGGGPG